MTYTCTDCLKPSDRLPVDEVQRPDCRHFARRCGCALPSYPLLALPCAVCDERRPERAGGGKFK